MKGKHITAEFWHCQCDPQMLCEADALRTVLCEAVETVGLTQVGYAEHTFISRATSQSTGVTLTVLLAESHLCVHTWGEEKTVTLDVYVCNFLNDNSDKADKLFKICRELFAPSDYNMNYLSRNHIQPNT